MEEIRFMDEQHEQNYFKMLGLMGTRYDCYHFAVAYLLALDVVCIKHIHDIFDFDNDSIKPQGTLNFAWQTGTSVKTTRLIFNLWNGCTSDYSDADDEKGEISSHFSVDEIFCCEYAPYYWEAIKLRYPEYTAN